MEPSYIICLFMLYDMNSIPRKYFAKVFNFNLLKTQFNFQFIEGTEDRGTSKLTQ